MNMIIFNPWNSPVVYSNDGHILGGGERREVESLDKHGERAVKHGYIVILDEEESQEDPAATEEEEAPGKEDATPARASRRSSKAKAKDEDSGASTGSEGD
jgi:hypothetical protein